MNAVASLPRFELVAEPTAAVSAPAIRADGDPIASAIRALPDLPEPTPRGLRRVIPRYVPGFDLVASDLWAHSVAVATMSQELAEALGGIEPSTAFRAGLFHDVGKIVCGPLLAEHTDLEEALRRGDMSFPEVEQVLLGLDHAEVGTEVALRWGLDATTVAAAGWHHAPYYVPDRTLARAVDIVHCADMLAHAFRYARDYGERPRRPDPDSLERLGATIPVLKQASARGLKRLREMPSARK